MHALHKLTDFLHRSQSGVFLFPLIQLQHILYRLLAAEYSAGSASDLLSGGRSWVISGNISKRYPGSRFALLLRIFVVVWVTSQLKYLKQQEKKPSSNNYFFAPKQPPSLNQLLAGFRRTIGPFSYSIARLGGMSTRFKAESKLPERKPSFS